jgi:hypothetical protein
MPEDNMRNDADKPMQDVATHIVHTRSQISELNEEDSLNALRHDACTGTMSIATLLNVNTCHSDLT